MLVIRIAAFTVPMLSFPTRWPRAFRAATGCSQCRIRLGCRPDMGSHPSRPQGSPAGTTDSIPSPPVLLPDGRPDATVHVRGMCDGEAGTALAADGGHPRQRLLVGVGTRGRLAPRRL